MKFCARYFESQSQDDEYNNSESDSFHSIVPAAQWNTQGDDIKYSLTLGSVYNDQIMPDNSTLWCVTLPQPYRPGLTTKVKVRNSAFTIPSVATFPTNIHIVAINSGIQGYLGYQGYNSFAIATYNLTDIVVLAPGTTPLFTCRYTMTEDTIFEIPLSTSQLQLKMFYDENGTPQTVPLGFNFGFRMDLTWRKQRVPLNLIQSQIQFQDLIMKSFQIMKS